LEEQMTARTSYDSRGIGECAMFTFKFTKLSEANFSVHIDYSEIRGFTAGDTDICQWIVGP
jgi:hypothetical protein